ncbi:MAG: protein kinase [Phycisphaerae bacterium]
MSTDWFERVQAVFHRARVLDSAARLAFLDEACAGDAALREEVESLLRIDSTPEPDFLDKPVVDKKILLEAANRGSECGDAALPESIGHYRVLRRLGAGGMGVVYEAQQEKTGSIVALKVIRSGFASHELLRRFEHEAQVLGRLRHPGIARIYEAGIHTEGDISQPFIAMEPIVGPSLSEYVKNESPDVRTILRLFALICDAVQHAHQHGVIHRDLKPGNILVERTDEIAQPKILDFGIARITDTDTLLTTRQTQAGQLIGTLRYMSPEQAAGDPADIDTRSDVYALGVILYEMLARRLPYEVDKRLTHEVVRVIREDEARPLSSVSRLYRGDLSTILGKVLDKEKGRRYQSASELATDIRRYLNSEPITAHPPSAMYQLRKFARRNRALVGTVAIVFVLLVSGIITTSWQAAAASKARDEAQAARLAEQKQRVRAERRFDEVRSLARSFIFEFYQKIGGLAGSMPARELLVRKGLQYIDSLSEDLDPHDVQLQAELGAAYFQLGDVQGDPKRSNLGDPEGALKSYLKGVTFVEAVGEAFPDHVDRQRNVGLAYFRISDLLGSMERWEEACEYNDRAQQLFERLSRTFSDNINIRRDLGQCIQFRSEEYKRNGRLDDSLISGLKALALFQSVLERNPNDVLNRHAVVSMSSLLAEILDRQGKPAQALHHRMESLTLLENLVKDNPHNAVFRRDLGIAAERVGFTYQQSGDSKKALPYCLRAAEVMRALIADDLNDEKARSDLIVAVIRTGETQLSLGQLADAEQTFIEHLKLCEDVARSHPDDSDALRRLGVAYYKLAELHKARANTTSNDPSLDHLREAHRWLSQCHAVFVDMRERALLLQADHGVPDEIAAEMKTCSERVAQFEQ